MPSTLNEFLERALVNEKKDPNIAIIDKVRDKLAEAKMLLAKLDANNLEVKKMRNVLQDIIGDAIEKVNEKFPYNYRK